VDYLLEFADREDVQGLARNYLERSDAVQGISVDLDDFWLANWRLYTLLSPTDFRFAQARLFDVWRYPNAWPWPNAAFSEIGRLGSFVNYPFGIDTSWRPPLWTEYIGTRDLRDEPYSISVILRPEVASQSYYALQEVGTNGFEVRFESRPTATLYANGADAQRPLVGGVSVSSPTGPAGTLGGILEDASGKRFGLTCAHVVASGDEAQQPSPRDNIRGAARIGNCVASSTLTSHTLPLDSSDPSINEVDVAAIELDQPADLEILEVGALAEIASKSRVNPDASVEVTGKSGRRSLYIGAISLMHEFKFQGTKYGYKNLFELKRQSRFWGLTGTLRPPVEPGDSGGWVLTAGANGMDWLGVIVAGDGPVGYATPADFVIDWLATSASIQPPVRVA
jgi:hypothetical protein